MYRLEAVIIKSETNARIIMALGKAIVSIWDSKNEEVKVRTEAIVTRIINWLEFIRISPLVLHVYD